MTDYTTIKIPVYYTNKIDKLVEQGIYSSRTDAVKDALRKLFDTLTEDKEVNL